MSKLLSVPEAALALNVSVSLVYSLCAKKKIRHERHGLKRGTIRIPEDAIEEYRRGATVGAAGPEPAAAPRAKLRHLRAPSG